MKICIVLNGEIEDYEVIRDIIIKECYDCIICVDGGVNYIYKMEIMLDYILGDLDLVEEEKINFYKNKGVKFEKFLFKKDEIDIEFCFFLVKIFKVNYIDFFGVLGGRIDYIFVNIKLLYYLKEDGIYFRIFFDKEEMYIVENEEILLYGNLGDIIFVIVINGDVKGVIFIGLEYFFDNYYMKYFVFIGILNVMLSNFCKIKVE